jgi:site-specific DNA recombinase
VSYLRVSTEKQADEGHSLGAQEARAVAYGVAHDVDIVGTEHDALTGKNTARPGLRRALAMLDAGDADGLLVMKMDRLTRSTRDFDDLLATYFTSGRFALLSVSDSVDTRSAKGRLVLKILMCVSQWEVEECGERTREGLAHARAKGGGTPRLEGAAVARIRELAASGLGLRAIARALADEGVPTLKGGKWAAETVRGVLARTAAAA